MMDWQWADQAACRGMDTEEFFPMAATGGYAARSSRPPKHIQRVCDACPVRIDCLHHALNTGEHGIWGGTTEAQRAAIRRRIRRRHCPSCGSIHLYTATRIQVCGDCGTSWTATTIPARSRSRRPNLGLRHRRTTAPAEAQELAG